MNWWDKNAEEKQFVDWVGEKDAESKVFTRRYVAKKGHESILDVGAGFCSEYYGYRSDGYKIKYTALDECEKFVERAKNRKIKCVLGSVEAIPFQDSEFDVVHMRHVLEHLSGYQKAIDEMIRVAKKEVVIIFFIKPGEKTEIRFADGLYHNYYSRNELGDYIHNNPKVEQVELLNINDAEQLWSITLK